MLVFINVLYICIYIYVWLMYLHAHVYIYVYVMLMYSPFNHSSGHGLSWGSGLLVRAIHAGHVLLPRWSSAQ